MTQLGFDLSNSVERRYECCGKPCADLTTRPSRDRPFPHAPDCPNPNVGQWIDRATGCIIRRLHCIAADGSCPYGGHPPEDPHMVDPYGGRCCLVVRRAENVIRVDGGAECPSCHRPYREHPWDEENVSGIDGQPFLRIGCDGRGLKL